MKIIHMNEGEKIKFQLKGTKLDLADGALSIDLARYQREEMVTRDIMIDQEGYLTTGRGIYYAAQIEIPGIEYKETEKAEGEPYGEELETKERLPLDTDDVTLKLFSIDGIVIY